MDASKVVRYAAHGIAHEHGTLVKYEDFLAVINQQKEDRKKLVDMLWKAALDENYDADDFLSLLKELGEELKTESRTVRRKVGDLYEDVEFESLKEGDTFLLYERGNLLGEFIAESDAAPSEGFAGEHGNFYILVNKNLNDDPTISKLIPAD